MVRVYLGLSVRVFRWKNRCGLKPHILKWFSSAGSTRGWTIGANKSSPSSQAAAPRAKGSDVAISLHRLLLPPLNFLLPQYREKLANLKPGAGRQRATWGRRTRHCRRRWPRCRGGATPLGVSVHKWLQQGQCSGHGAEGDSKERAVGGRGGETHG